MSSPHDDHDDERPRLERPRGGDPAAAARMKQQERWVDLQIRKAIERGDFDDLPGKGKPLHLDDDPDWWLKRFVQRERITVLPEALQLRKDDAELDARLDRLHSERDVREALEVINKRIVVARRQLQGGPPVVTPTRDVEAEVERWRERRRR
jgi:hypothetical protein